MPERVLVGVGIELLIELGLVQRTEEPMTQVTMCRAARGVSLSTVCDGWDDGDRPGSTSWMDSHQAYRKLRERTLSHKWAGLVRSTQRLIASGHLGPETQGGVFNPGALFQADQFCLLCRGEIDDTTWVGDWFYSRAVPLWCELDDQLTLKRHQVLRYRDLPTGLRPEDWRLFAYQGKLYANHSTYYMDDDNLQCRPCLSEIEPERGAIRFRCMLQPPFEASQEEKNWAMFVHEDGLLCIYSFRPYIILKIDLERGVTQLHLAPRGLTYPWYDEGKSFVGNSTNPISWDDAHYIMFIHDFIEPPNREQRNRVYVQYAALISKSSLLPTSVIPLPLVIGGCEQGRHPGVHYTTALVNGDDGLYAFYGEGDTHTGVVVFDKAELSILFDLYQFDLYQNEGYVPSRRGLLSP